MRRWCSLFIDKSILNGIMKSNKARRFFSVPQILLKGFALVLGIWLTLTIAIAPVWAVSYDKVVLRNEDFSGQDLRDASFDHADLRGSNFSNANLRGVRLFAANLDSVNFEGADLTGADLESARLTKVNFTNAILEGAFATNTLFNGAIIDGADFTDALLRSDIQKKLCEVAKGTNPTTGRDTRESLLCP